MSLRVSELGERGIGLKARSASAMFAPPICRRGRRKASKTELTLPHSHFVGFDEDGGCQQHRSERSRHQTQRTGERGSKHEVS
jgi:hypothetical protein